MKPAGGCHETGGRLPAYIYKGYQYMARNIVNGGEWWYNIAVAGVPVIQRLRLYGQVQNGKRG